MRHIRQRLTYANVMSSIAVFLVLGGAAFAASRLPKNSVGTKQLKKNAVTAAKLHKNAVTKAKIAAGAVNGSKIANGSVTGADINAESTPFGRVVARLRGNASLGLTEAFQAYALNPSTYTQAAEEVDTYVGAADVTFQPTCKPPREAVAFVALDAPNPTNFSASNEEGKIAGSGGVSDLTAGTVSKRIEVGPNYTLGHIFEPGTAKSHTVSLAIEGECEGGGSGVTATFGGVDVIGTK